ncbi:MAG TPA: DUF1501 domain-containing protein, partial [Verrucomicrobiae bacterium]|nr:DUF1501 domain-containing protein [Verrucomicrobiae bacterium]
MHRLFQKRGSLLTRRHFLWETGAGFSGLALAWLFNQEARAVTPALPDSPYAPKPTHFPARAKRVIHICACGGVSHVDTFDYKPELAKHQGEELTNKGKIDTFFGRPGRLQASPFAFAQHGQSGKWVSDLLPHIAGCVDDLTFIHSMSSKSSNHTPATFFMNTGFTMNGFPCLGSWLSYGLGSENQNLPAFVVLPDPRQLPAGGAINWTSGFLPAVHQGVALRTTGEAIHDLNTPADISPGRRAAEMKLLARMNQDFLAANPDDSTLAARIRSYELAARMQLSVPEVVDLAGESDATKKLYGLDQTPTAGFGRNCLLARRLVEKGVRFVQLFHGGAFGSPRINWDGHENLAENHRNQAISLDQPVAALIQDLKARGMLSDTLVLWTTEFGRTPVTEGVGGKGRDHHPHGFTIWMAGAGLKPGFSYGATDEVGYFASENKVQVYDFHATVLHLLGLN